MSRKDNKFIITLGGITLGVAAALVFVGLKGASKYQAALDKYTSDSEAVGGHEALPLYPTDENRNGKRKALVDYRDAVTGLQNSFNKFRPDPAPEQANIAPQELTNRLKAATSEITTAFAAANTTFPETFFSGFEGYSTGTLAKDKATGILDYQLGAVRELFLSLAKSKPSQLINVYRPRLPEEDGGEWKPGANDASRALPLEVIFKGTEDSLRGFLSSLAASDKHYYVIRSIRISNEKKTPPLATDAKFEAAPESSAPAPADGGFALPPDPNAPAAPAAAAAPVDAAPAAPVTTDSSQILYQVLGSEQILVFLRLDVMEFLAPKALPQP